MNFRGNVAVVDNNDGTVDFWFMNPDNNSTPTTATETGAPDTEMYVYSGANSISGLTADDIHDRCTADESGSITYKLSGTGKSDKTDSETMSALNKNSTIKVEILNGDGTVKSTTISPAICEANASNKLRGGNITKTENGVSIALTHVIDNTVNSTNNDAQNGYTPGYVRFKGKVTVTTATVLGTDGGTYKVRISFNDGTKDTVLGTSRLIYSYNSDKLTAEDAPTATLTYKAETTKSISGITYDSAANVIMTVTDIKGTQRGGAHKNAQSKRATMDDVTESDSQSIVNPIGGDISTTLQSASTTQNTTAAIFKGTKSVSCSNEGEPKQVKISGGGTVYTYDQNGTKSTDAKATPDPISASTWLQTSGVSTKVTKWSSASSPINFTFTDDGARVLAEYSEENLISSHETWNNTANFNEAAGYDGQLLVQGTSLRYPNTDVTGTYSGMTGWKSYVVPVTFASGISQLTVTINGLSSFNNSNYRAFIVGNHPNSGLKAFCLTWAKGDNTNCIATTGAAACATSNPSSSSNSWSIECDPTWMALDASGSYYIVIQMNDTAINTKFTGFTLA